MIYIVLAHEYYKEVLSLNSYRNWMRIISNYIETVSIALLGISTIEFLSSQTPYSMRGLIIGGSYGSGFIFAMIGYGIYWLFTHQLSTWATGIFSREFWYLLFQLLTLIIISGILLGVR